MRDHKWLKTRLIYIWHKYFPDVILANNVIVKFGRPTITRLGSIKLGREVSTSNILNNSKSNRNTIITINGHFTDPEIPEYVIDAVLVHELTHYAHGFCSPHQQAFRHPHRGGIVKNEMIDRGLKELLKSERKWIKDNWRDYLKIHHY